MVAAAVTRSQRPMEWRDTLREVVASVPPNETADLIGEIARYQAVMLARLSAPATTAAAPSSPELDKWLTADEVAAALSVSRRYVYEHVNDFPFAKRLPGDGAIRFSLKGLRRFMERH